jgi:hypothetical protein
MRAATTTGAATTTTATAAATTTTTTTTTTTSTITTSTITDGGTAGGFVYTAPGGVSLSTEASGIMVFESHTVAVSGNAVTDSQVGVAV